MPLITRRSSTRGLPLVPVGRWGAIRANCLSVSQKWSRLIGVPPQGAVNHETTRTQTGLMGPDPKRAEATHCDRTHLKERYIDNAPACPSPIRQRFSEGFV